MYTVENERLLWELEQMRGMADVNEVTRLRTEIDGLRQEMLHMANRYESLEVINCCCCCIDLWLPRTVVSASALRNVAV